jgi:hypothetical protein
MSDPTQLTPETTEPVYIDPYQEMWDDWNDDEIATKQAEYQRMLDDVGPEDESASMPEVASTLADEVVPTDTGNAPSPVGSSAAPAVSGGPNPIPVELDIGPSLDEKPTGE